MASMLTAVLLAQAFIGRKGCMGDAVGTMLFEEQTLWKDKTFPGMVGGSLESSSIQCAAACLLATPPSSCTAFSFCKSDGACGLLLGGVIFDSSVGALMASKMGCHLFAGILHYPYLSTPKTPWNSHV